MPEMGVNAACPGGLVMHFNRYARKAGRRRALTPAALAFGLLLATAGPVASVTGGPAMRATAPAISKPIPTITTEVAAARCGAMAIG